MQSSRHYRQAEQKIENAGRPADPGARSSPWLGCARRVWFRRHFRTSSLRQLFALRMRFMCRLQELRGHPGRRPAEAAAQPGCGKNTKARYPPMAMGTTMSATVTVKSLRKIRFDDPEQIEVAHQQQPDRKPHQLANVALEWAREQHRERNDEVETEPESARSIPSRH